MRLDHIVVDVEFLVKPGMDHRHVIALEIVVDVHLPVAVNAPFLRCHIAHRLGGQRCAACREIRQKVRQRLSLEIEGGEDERSPRGHLHRLQVKVARAKVLIRLHEMHGHGRHPSGISPVATRARFRSPLPLVRANTRAENTGPSPRVGEGHRSAGCAGRRTARGRWSLPTCRSRRGR